VLVETGQGGVLPVHRRSQLYKNTLVCLTNLGSQHCEVVVCIVLVSAACQQVCLFLPVKLFAAGVVPRPGDPNYVPTQLARIWDRAGDLWVQQQLRRAQQDQQPGEGMSRQNSAASGLLQMAPMSSAPVDWPWRPRDLEALLTRFTLLTDRRRCGRPYCPTAPLCHLLI